LTLAVVPQLRNPLNGVLGLLACVREEIEGLRHSIHQKDFVACEHKAKYAAQFLEHIDECAQHQRVIMDDVLSLSRLETADSTISNHSTFDPRRTLDSVVNMFNGMSRMKNLQFQLNTDELPQGSEGFVVADENRIKQILINLVSNAVKFSKDGGRVTITFRRFSKPQNDDDESNEHVYLEGSVADCGKGITDEEQALLFAPFANLKRKRVLEYGRSGLGLRITKELVEAMHGNISVRSKLGEGSVFTFAVRCGRPEPGAQVSSPPTVDRALDAKAASVGMVSSEAAEALLNEAQARVQREASVASSRQPRVLVCEDNHINQMVLSRFLERRGVEYTVAASGEDALRLYRESLDEADQRYPFDLVFMVRAPTHVHAFLYHFGQCSTSPTCCRTSSCPG
jgi:two-component sensor histidine kinase